MAIHRIPRTERLLSGTIINVGIDDNDTQVELSNPPSAAKLPMLIQLEPDDVSKRETVRAIAVSGSTVTIERGIYNGGVGVAHLVNKPYEARIASYMWEKFADYIEEGYLTEDSLAHPFTRVDATHFRVAGGDHTAYYTRGRVVRFNQSDSSIATIASSTYDSGNTRTEVTLLTGTIPSSLTSIEIGIQSRGAVFPTAAEIQAGATIYAVDTGSANALVITLAPAPAAYTAGMVIRTKPANNNTGAATINVNGLGAKSIKTINGSDPSAGQIKANTILELAYDGTNFQITSDVQVNADVSSSLEKQAAMNGNFNIWQRGASFTNPSINAFTADRFAVRGDAAGGTLPTTITHARNTLTAGELDKSFYSYRISPNGAGSGFGNNAYYAIEQRIEKGTRLLGGASKKLTVSFYAKSSIASKKVAIALVQNYGTGGSPSSAEYIQGSTVTLNGTLQKITVTFTLNTLSGKTFGTDNNDYIGILIGAMWGSTPIGTNLGWGAAETFVGSGDIDIAQLQINSGDTALAFMPKSIADELLECQRYFCKSYGLNVAPGTVSTEGVSMGLGLNAAARPIMHIQFPSKMYAVPTVHPYSPATGTIDKIRDASAGSDLNAAALYAGESSVQIYDSTSTVPLGNHVLFHWTAEAEV